MYELLGDMLRLRLCEPRWMYMRGYIRTYDSYYVWFITFCEPIEIREADRDSSGIFVWLAVSLVFFFCAFYSAFTFIFSNPKLIC